MSDLDRQRLVARLLRELAEDPALLREVADAIERATAAAANKSPAKKAPAKPLPIDALPVTDLDRARARKELRRLGYHVRARTK